MLVFSSKIPGETLTHPEVQEDMGRPKGSRIVKCTVRLRIAISMGTILGARTDEPNIVRVVVAPLFRECEENEIKCQTIIDLIQ